MRSYNSDMRKTFLVGAKTIILCGLFIFLFALISPLAGFGSRENFILYKHFAWTRNQTAHAGFDAIMLGIIILLAASPIYRVKAACFLKAIIKNEICVRAFLILLCLVSILIAIKL